MHDASLEAVEAFGERAITCGQAVPVDGQHQQRKQLVVVFQSSMKPGVSLRHDRERVQGSSAEAGDQRVGCQNFEEGRLLAAIAADLHEGHSRV